MGGLADAIGASLRLDPALWRDLLVNPDALRFQLAAWIVVLAGVSEALAQSTVLFVSRVRPSRFLASLLLSAALLALSYLFFVVSIEVLAASVFGRPRLNAVAFEMIALTYAPYLLAATTLMPYFGRAVSIGLAVYHVLALLIAVTVCYDFTPQQGALCLGLSWLAVQLLRGSLGRPLVGAARMLRDRVAGTALMDREELKRYYRGLVGEGRE